MRPAYGGPIELTPGTQPYAMPPRPAAHYGTQREVSYRAGEAKAAQLAECGPTSLLWRVCASGVNCRFALRWGSYAQRELTDLVSPLAITVGGSFNLSAIPIDPDAAMEAASNVSVSSGGVAIARTLETTTAVLPPTAYRVTALAASTVSVNGTAVVLGVGATLDVVYPSSLTVGGPLIVDHAL